MMSCKAIKLNLPSELENVSITLSIKKSTRSGFNPKKPKYQMYVPSPFLKPRFACFKMHWLKITLTTHLQDDHV